MRKMTNKISFLLVLVMFLGYIGNSNIIPANAATNYVSATRTITPATIYPDQEAEVTLDVKGTPPVNVVKPNDIMMILDKSGSMVNDNRFTAMQSSAKEFVDLIDFTNHQVGVVDFSTSASAKDLTTDAASLKDYIGKITCGGGTGTGAAIRAAITKLKNGRSTAQPVILLLTDGQADSSADALAAAQEAKDAGIVFYTIALLGPTENPVTSAPNLLLEQMATTAQHHHFVLGSVGLMDIYKAIVKEIGISSAYDVTITENVSPEFEIVPDSYKDSIPVPTVNGNTLTWDMQELKDQTLSLKYKVRAKSTTKLGTYNVSSGAKIDYSDYTGARCSYTIPNGTLEVKNYPPTITSIDPISSESVGGGTATIKGDNFRTGATVKFNTTLATNVTVVDKNTITATIPAGKAGNAIVTVTNDDNQAATTAFTYYVTPQITSVTPASGLEAGGNIIYINGTNFVSGITATIGGQTANVAVYDDSTQIRVTVPAGTAGIADVVVTNPGGKSATLTGGYEYVKPAAKPAPAITSVTPASGLEAGGNTIYVKGTDFVSGITATIGGKAANVAVYDDSTQIRVTVPAGTAGKVDVTVTNPDGQSVTLAGGYEYVKPAAKPAPAITSVTPASGLEVGGNTVYIKGTNFVSGITATIGGIAANVSIYDDSTQIRVTVPAGTLGKADVTVTNPDGQSVTLTGGYEYVKPAAKPAPAITSVTPASGLEAGGNVISIAGTNFVNGITATIGGKVATVSMYYDATQINVKVPAGTAGKADVVLTNPDGQSVTLASGYEYIKAAAKPAPAITSVTPASGLEAGGNIVYIKGTDFVSGITATIGGQTANVAVYDDSTQIRVTVPAGTAGKVDVTVTNPDGQSVTLASGYEYTKPAAKPAPAITSVTPASGLEAGGNIVYIKGTDFVSGITATIGGQTANVAVYDDSTQIRVTVPAGTAGKVDVTVTNPDGQSVTLASGYEYKVAVPVVKPAPEIISLSATSGVLTGGNNIYINGKNFVSGITATIGGKTATVNSYIDSTMISVKVPAGTVAGTADVVVTNPDGQSVTLAGGYQYLAPAPKPAPVITSLSPASGLVAGGYYAYINGSNFVSGITATIGGINATVAMYYDATQIRVKVPAGTLGTADVVVTNPDGQSVTLAGGFEYIKAPAPVITSLSKTSGVATSTNSISILGKNFVNGVTVTIGGKTATVNTYVDSTQLSVTVPVGTVGKADVIVTNPDGQSVTLAGGYEYLAAAPKPAPVITSLSVTSGVLTGGNNIYINGKNFVSGITAKIGGKTATVSYVDSTMISVKVPAGTVAGTADVVVTNLDGQSVTLAGGYQYLAPAPKPAPVITSLSVTSGVLTGGNNIYINGKNFVSGITAKIGGKTATVVSYVDSTMISVKVPAGTVVGTADVAVTNPDAQSVTLVGGYTYK